MEMREWKDPRNGTTRMIAREDAYPPRMSFRNRSTLEHYSTDRHPPGVPSTGFWTSNLSRFWSWHGEAELDKTGFRFIPTRQTRKPDVVLTPFLTCSQPL